MPRYVIEMDEPRSCYTCACINAQLGQCQLAYRTVPKSLGTPEWCPLKPLEDSSQTTKPKTVLRIQQVLRERGLSQSKAARLADVNDTSMSRIVRGIEPAYPKRGKRIAEALDWEGDWRELFEEVTV